MHLTYGRLAVLPLHLPLHALEAFTNKNNFSIESNWNALIRFPTSNGAKCCHSFPLISTCGSYMEIILFESPFIRKLYAQILTSKLCYFDRKVETVGRMCQNFFHLYSNEILINFFFLSRISFVLLTYLFLRFGIHVIANVVIRYFFFFLGCTKQTSIHVQIECETFHFENLLQFDKEKHHTPVGWRNSSGLQAAIWKTLSLNLNDFII